MTTRKRRHRRAMSNGEKALFDWFVGAPSIGQHRPEPRHRCGKCALCVRSIEAAEQKRARRAARNLGMSA